MTALRRRLVVHVGLAKTATTSLQLGLFSSHSGIHYFGRPFAEKRLADAVYRLAYTDSLTYDPGEATAAFDEALTGIADDARPIVLSYENLSLYEARDVGQVARRLHDAVPGARILITIRRQEDLIESYYFQRLRSRIMADDWVGFGEWAANAHHRSHASIFMSLDYHTLVSAYARLFGRENVCVLLLEELTTKPESFVEKLCDFLRIDREEAAALLAHGPSNPRMRRRYYLFGMIRGLLVPKAASRALRRAIPGFVSRPFVAWLDRGGPAPRVMSSYWRERVRAACAEGNRQLAEAFALDLAGHGYALGGATR